MSEATARTADLRPRLRALMAAFIVSEAAFFLMLILGYVRFRAVSDQTAAHVLHLPQTAVATALLLSSSVTIHFASRAVARGRSRAARIGLALTVALGVAFLGMQGLEWHGLIASGLRVASGTFGTTFFTVTGLHGLHVAVGLVAVTTMLVAISGKTRASHGPALEAVSLYWHFVDVVWLCVFSVIYLGAVL